VIHYEFPNNIEAYFQEAGRAGRDGLESRTFVFYETRDLDETTLQIDKQFPPIETVKNTYSSLCNYLKLAVGSGEGETYPVNLKTLTDNFKLDLIETYQSLKILEMNGDLQFTESVFHPTKIKFSVGNTVLYSFQIKYENTANLITLISRSYPGIFDQYFELHEAEFCKRLNISPAELEKQLKFLEQNGILDINWKTDLPLVTFLTERVPDQNFRLIESVYHNRKNLAEKRWFKMRELLTLPVCRSQYIIQYFGQESKSCGKCDHCRSLKREDYTQEEIGELLLEKLHEPHSLEEIKAEYLHIKQDQIIRVLNWLMQEERIFYKNGKYCW
jgi:ATP-dependent DNA helicase RecQ